jgi:membrane-bound serine protease (ClpP class)
MVKRLSRCRNRPRREPARRGCVRTRRRAVQFIDGPHVVVCPVEDMIDDGVHVLIKRAIREASNAEAIIFVIDTPGGLVDAAIEITQAIVEAPVPTIAYVRGMGAISAGALISAACDDIMMAPASSIGAAQIVAMGPEGSVPLGEKETSFMRAKMRSLAESKGHNADLFVGMVDKDIELKAVPNSDGTYTVYATNRGQSRAAADDGEEKPTSSPADDIIDQLADDSIVPLDPLKDAARDLVREVQPEVEDMPPPEPPQGYDIQEDGSFIFLSSGKLLTLTSNEAVQFGLAGGIAGNIDEVKARYGYEDAGTHEIIPTWSEDLYRWVTSPIVTSLLLLLGMGGLYMEIRTPGFGFFGVIGIVCLTVFFGSRYIIGLSEWIDLLVIGVGVALLAIELFFLPGFGVFGIAGIGCILTGFYLSLTYHDFKIPEYSWEVQRLMDAGYSIFFAMVMLIGLVAATWKLLPYTPLYGRLFLAEEQLVADGYVSPTEYEGESLIGSEGTATSLLRPSGLARFGSKSYRVVSRSEYIEPGTPIVIVEEDGSRLVVERRKETA